MRPPTGDEGVAACRTSSPGWKARSRSSPGPGACARSAGRSPSSWPGPAATSCSPAPVDRPTATRDDEKEAGWRDIASVAEEVEALGRRALPLVSRRRRPRAVERLRDPALDDLRPGRHRREQRRRRPRRRPQAGRRPRPGPLADRHRRQPDGHVPHVEGVRPRARRPGAGRIDRQHLVHRRQDVLSPTRPPTRPPRRAPGHDGVHGPGGRRVRRPGQRHLPRDHRHVPHGRPRPGRGLGADVARRRPARRAGTGEDIA